MCFRCRSDDHFIKNDPKLDTSDKKFYWNTKNSKTGVYRSTEIYKTSKNSAYQIESKKIYMSMAHISFNEEIPRWGSEM